MRTDEAMGATTVNKNQHYFIVDFGFQLDTVGVICTGESIQR